MKVVRIFTGDDGESHFEDMDIEFSEDGFGGLLSSPVKTKSVIFRKRKPFLHH